LLAGITAFAFISGKKPDLHVSPIYPLLNALSNPSLESFSSGGDKKKKSERIGQKPRRDKHNTGNKYQNRIDNLFGRHRPHSHTRPHPLHSGRPLLSGKKRPHHSGKYYDNHRIERSNQLPYFNQKVQFSQGDEGEGEYEFKKHVRSGTGNKLYEYYLY
jgi:hypothetical protein